MLERRKIDLSIREMRPSDLETLMQIKNAENWNQTEEDWLFLINSNPQYCLVAVSENRVIGTVTAMSYPQSLAWIGMMLVDKNYRGLSISKILLHNILKRLDTWNSIKLDATPAGVPVYKKLGFLEEYRIDRMVCSKISAEIIVQEDTKSFEISNICPTDIYELIRLDEAIFGVERSELFHFLLKNKAALGFQIKQGNILKGFMFSREGSNYLQIGPLIADSIDMAKLLLKVTFEALKGKPLLVDVMSNQKKLKEWLLFKKFKHQRSFTRMYLKTNVYSREKGKQYLICGPELG